MGRTYSLINYIYRGLAAQIAVGFGLLLMVLKARHGYC